MPSKHISSSSAAPVLPKNWPATIPYLTKPIYSPTLTPTHLCSLRTKPETALEVLPKEAHPPKGHSPLVKITSITDPKHPANGQAGLFAVRDLKPGSFILEYLGVIHASPPSSEDEGEGEGEGEKKGDPHAHSDYDLSLDRYLNLAIDAAKVGNEARFINDYRGIADRPSAEFREIWHPARERTGERGMGVWVLPVGKSGNGKGGIRKGEEILVSYGKGFWGARKERVTSNH